jgi:hypothetical protein
MTAYPSPRCAPARTDRQARLDYLVLALGQAHTPARRRQLWAEIVELKRTMPKAERNALARRQGLPEEL